MDGNNPTTQAHQFTDIDLPELTEKAEELYRLLRALYRWSLTRNFRTFKPRQAVLARKLGRSVRSIQLYLDELEGAGLIKKLRTRTGNSYVFLEVPMRKSCASPGAKVAHGEAQELRVATRKICASPGAKVAHGYISDSSLLNSSLQQQQPAAAADLLTPLEKQDAAHALLGLDLPPPLAERHAAADPKLAIVVATYAADRFRDARQRPISNKIGFVLGALRWPEKYGIFRAPGGDWIPPAAQGDAGASAARKKDAAAAAAQRSQAQAQEAAHKAAAQADLARSEAEWAALGEDDRREWLQLALAQPQFRGTKQRPGSFVIRQVAIRLWRESQTKS